MSRTRWTILSAGNGQSFVYSPRFGRTYLLAEELATSPALPKLLGVKPVDYREQLYDPAKSIHLVGDKDCLDLENSACRFLPLLYRFFHRHRLIASINSTVRLIRMHAFLRRNRLELSIDDIGQIARSVESVVGISDCYPRALVTLYLCVAAQLPCQLAVGILSPTRNLHAWCSVNGVIPYEPSPYYWWYRPLVVCDVEQDFVNCR